MCFGSFSSKRETYKMNKFSIFKFLLQRFQKPPVLSKNVFGQFFTKWTACVFKFSKFQSFQNPSLLSIEVFEQFFVKQATYKMSKVCVFKFLKFQSFQNSSFLSKEVLDQFFTKRAAYKMRKVCFSRQMFQNTVVE